jgi:hypothetical protein
VVNGVVGTTTEPQIIQMESQTQSLQQSSETNVSSNLDSVVKETNVPEGVKLPEIQPQISELCTEALEVGSSKTLEVSSENRSTQKEVCEVLATEHIQQSSSESVSKTQEVHLESLPQVCQEVGSELGRLEPFLNTKPAEFLQNIPDQCTVGTLQQELYALSGTRAVETKTVDEEVQDLCEREFNELSFKYEKIQKEEMQTQIMENYRVQTQIAENNRVQEQMTENNRVQAPKAENNCVQTQMTQNNYNQTQMAQNNYIQTQITQNNRVEIQMSENNRNQTEVQAASQSDSDLRPVKVNGGEQRKPYKKPGSMVPGAKPLFGGAIDIHMENNAEEDKPYEKIPVKKLINTFEQSTRPMMKVKQVQDRIPGMPTDQQQTSSAAGVISSSTVQSTTAQQNLTSSVDPFATTQQFDLLQEKRNIYDQHMQKYKEEAKQLQMIVKQEQSSQMSTQFQQMQSLTQQQTQTNHTRFEPQASSMPLQFGFTADPASESLIKA